jgi:hypothetical protein
VTDEQLRPESISRLTTTRVSSELAAAVADATPTEREVASRILLDQAREILEQAGVIPRAGTVLDLSLRHATALAGTYAAVGRTWRAPGNAGKRLGVLLKVVSPEEAQLAAAWLAWGGLVEYHPPEEGRDAG